MKSVRILIVVALTIGAVGCGRDSGSSASSEDKELTHVNYYIGLAPFAGISPWFVGQEKGFFADEGVDVEFLPGESPSALPSLISSGKADMGSIDFTSLALAKDEDPDLAMKLVAIHYARSAAVISSLKDGADITRPEDVQGVPIYERVGGISGAVIGAWADRLGLKDVGTKEVAPEVLLRLLLSGEAPAISTNSFLRPQIASAAREADEEVVWLELAHHGLTPFYGSGISAGDDFIEEDPEAVSGFVAAARRSFEYCFEHPEEAGTIMEDLFPTIPAETVPPALEEVEKVVTDDGKLDEIFGIDPAKAAGTVQWAKEAFGVKVDAEDLYTTEFID